MPKETNKDKALVALLNTNSVRDAAKLSKLSEPTLYRYLAEPEFARELREARRKTLEGAIGQLQRLTGKAADTLERNMNCENPAVETRTAQIVFEQAIKGVETLNLLERVEALENANR